MTRLLTYKLAIWPHWKEKMNKVLVSCLSFFEIAIVLSSFALQVHHVSQVWCTASPTSWAHDSRLRIQSCGHCWWNSLCSYFSDKVLMYLYIYIQQDFAVQDQTLSLDVSSFLIHATSISFLIHATSIELKAISNLLFDGCRCPLAHHAAVGMLMSDVSWLAAPWDLLAQLYCKAFLIQATSMSTM